MYKSDYTDFLRNCSYGKVKFAPGDAGVTVGGCFVGWLEVAVLVIVQLDSERMRSGLEADWVGAGCG